MFIKDFSVTFATKVLSLIISIFTGVIIARFLGPEDRGIYVTVTTLVSIISLFGSFGFEASNTYFVGKRKYDLKDIVSNSFIFGIIIGIVIAVIGSTLYIYTNTFLIKGINKYYVIFTMFLTPFILVSKYFQAVLQGLQKFVYYNKITFGFTLLNFLSLALILIGLNGKVLGAIFNYIIITTLSFCFLVYYMSRYTTISLSVSKDFFEQSFGVGFKAFIVILIANLMLQLDILLVNYYLGPKAVGFYSLSVSFAELLLFIPSSINFIHFPKVSSMQSIEARNFTQQVSKHNFFLTVFLSIIIAVVGNQLIPILYGAEFMPSYELLILLIPGMIAFSFASTFTSYFQGMGFPPVTYIAPFFGLVINTILDIILLPRIGIVGASIATSAAYIIHALILVVFFVYTTKMPLTKLIFLEKRDLVVYTTFFSSVLKKIDIVIQNRE